MDKLLKKIRAFDADKLDLENVLEYSKIIENLNEENIQDIDDVRKAFNISKNIIAIRNEELSSDEKIIKELRLTIDDLRDQQVELELENSEFQRVLNTSREKTNIVDEKRIWASERQKLEKEIEDLNKENDRLKEISQELEKDVPLLKIQLEKAKSNVKELEERAEFFQARLNEKNASKSSTQDMTIIKKEVSTLRYQLRKKNGEIDSLEEEKASLEKDIERLEKGFRKATRDLDGCADEIESLKRALNEADRKYSELKSSKEVGGLRPNQTVSDEGIEINNEILGLVETKIQDWKKMMNEKDSQIVKLFQENKSLLQKLNSLNVDANVAKLTSLNEEIRKKNAEIDLLRDSLSQATRELESNQKIFESLINKNSETSELDPNVRIIRLERMVAEKEKLIGKMEQMKKDSEAETIRLSIEAKGASERLQKYEAGVYGLREAVDQLTAYQFELASKEKQLNEVCKELTELELSLDDIQAENDFLRDKAGISKEENLNLNPFKKARIVRDKKEHFQNDLLLKEVENLEEERLKLKRQIRALVKELSKSDREVPLELMDFIGLEEKELERGVEVEKPSTAFQSRISSQNDEIKRLTEEKAALLTEKKVLTERSNQLQQMNGQLLGVIQAIKTQVNPKSLKATLTKDNPKMGKSMKEPSSEEAENNNKNILELLKTLEEQNIVDHNESSFDDEVTEEESNHKPQDHLEEEDAIKYGAIISEANEKIQILLDQHRKMRRDYEDEVLAKEEALNDLEREKEENQILKRKAEAFEKETSSLQHVLGARLEGLANGNGADTTFEREYLSTIREVTNLRINESLMARSAALASKTIEKLEKKNIQLESDFVQLVTMSEAKIGYYKRLSDTSDFRLNVLKQELENTLPKDLIDDQRKENDCLRQQLEKVSLIIERNKEQALQFERLFKEYDSLRKELERKNERIVLEIEKNTKLQSELSIFKGLSNLDHQNEEDSFKREIAVLSRRLAGLESAKMNEKERLAHLEKMNALLNDQIVELTTTNLGLNKKVEDLQQKLNESLTTEEDLQRALSNTITKEECAKIKAELQGLASEKLELTHEIERVKESSYIAIEQFKLTQHQQEVDEVERARLKERVKMLESADDKASMMSSLHRDLTNAQLSEASTLHRYALLKRQFQLNENKTIGQSQDLTSINDRWINEEGLYKKKINRLLSTVNILRYRLKDPLNKTVHLNSITKLYEITKVRDLLLEQMDQVNLVNADHSALKAVEEFHRNFNLEMNELVKDNSQPDWLERAKKMGVQEKLLKKLTHVKEENGKTRKNEIILRNKVDYLEGKLDIVNNMIKSYEEQIRCIDEEKMRLENRIDANEIEWEEQEMQKLPDSTQVNEKTDAKQKDDSTGENFLKAIETIKKLSSDLLRANEELNTLKNSYAEIVIEMRNSSSSETLTELAVLRRLLAEANARSQLKESVIVGLKGTSDQQTEPMHHVENVQEKNVPLNMKGFDQSEVIKQLKAEIQDKESNLRAKEAKSMLKIQELSAELINKEEQIERFSSLLKDLEKDRTKLKEAVMQSPSVKKVMEINELKTSLREKTRQCDSLTRAMHELHKKMMEIDRKDKLKEERIVKSAILRSKDEEIKRNRDLIQRLHQKIASLTYENEMRVDSLNADRLNNAEREETAALRLKVKHYEREIENLTLQMEKNLKHPNLLQTIEPATHSSVSEERLKRQNKDFIDRIEELSNLNCKLEDKIEKLERNKVTNEKQILTLKRDILSMECEISQLRSVNLGSSRPPDTLEKLGLLEDKIAGLEKENFDLKEKIIIFEESRKARSPGSLKIGESGKSREELERIISVMKKIIKKTSAENMELKESAEQRMNDLKRANESLQNELNSVIGEKKGQELKDRIIQNESLDRITAEYDRMRNQLIMAKEENEKLRNRLA